MYVKARETCRVCGSNKLTQILSLGDQFVTDFVGESKKDYVKGPLEHAFSVFSHNRLF
jgi:hypothetical protein